MSSLPSARHPSFELAKFESRNVRLYAKLESFNPGGSVKDRLALGVIEDAERRGALRPGMTVVEATSGNTGIGLALVCAEKGYPLVIVMAESFSVERRKLMRFLGARVVLTPASLKGTGMVAKARELAEAHGWFFARQFENEANAAIHAATTAREILEAFKGERLDYWVTGYGTGGTLNGVGRVLRAESPDTKVIVCEPDNSPLLGSGAPQARNADGSASESHAAFRPHVMQGWTPDFISKLTGDAVSRGQVDQVIAIHGGDAMRCSRDFARKAGVFVGTTSGATLAGAMKLMETAPEGSTILCMLADTGERYLSTPLFEGISEGMSEEEMEISRSTPAARFDVCAVPAPAAAAPLVAADAEAVGFVAEVVASPREPVVLFALEWCEFCWSVRKFFGRLGVPYHAVDLDSVVYQKDNLGGRIRAALRERTGSVTIPQIFVGGKFVGGCSDLFDAWKSSRLQELLQASNVNFKDEPDFDAYTLLPKWLQPRAA
ncbi:MAG: pyridoxal-phosphate dependent enzyme [Hyphomonadaceae bacterium]